jgi:hypothetical protein
MTWVRDEDLVETVYDLRVVNSATSTKASSSRGAEISELSQDGVMLRVPRGLCAEGHLLSIEVTLRRVPPSGRSEVMSRLVGTGKVINTAPFDGTTMVISVRFYQFDDAAWADFRDRHAKRQIRVSTTLRQRQE